ncbi:MAG: hypothetical protein HUJ31_03460, partial [Pseudomonadales bacterium]|nr:hypothetical protein [Pseudomonadales bacterium]
LTGNSDELPPTIQITQDKFDGALPTTLSIPDIDQDIFVVGDVINENGALIIDNREGSINVSGNLRAETITIRALKDFNLNTQGWFHTNKDPRQYIDFGRLTADAILDAGNAVYDDATKVRLGLQVPTYDEHGVFTGYADTSPTVSDYGSAGAVKEASGKSLAQAIAEDNSSIVAQGQISITAQYLNVNGLIQSGVETVKLHVAPTFNPVRRANFTDSNGNTLGGITFAEINGFGVPIDGYFDPSRGDHGAIIVEEIAPAGGEIIIAGRILSTGNGELKVANGYTNVDIVNQTDFDLVLQGIDTTTNREGKITIIDTNRPGGPQKDVYYATQGQVLHQRYTGTANQPDENGNFPVDQDTGGVSLIDYDPVFVDGNGNETPIQYSINATNITYDTQSDLVYVWVEGQEKVKESIYKKEKKSFNLFGDNWFADLLVADFQGFNETTKYSDEKPLLESESLEKTTGDLGYANDDAYTIRYEQVKDLDVDTRPGSTKVKDVGTGKWYLYSSSATPGEAYLPGIDYANDANWEEITNQATLNTLNAIDFNEVENIPPDTYESSFVNYLYDLDQWT